MAAEIERQRPDAQIQLVGEEDAPGTFNVFAAGKQLWSKHETGKFPEPNDIVAMIPAKAAPPSGS
ncbi:MAG: Rdx family protein [Deltaproteobacteria bacterium]|nr:Rdx family protein [Deltaproteobacteria bacterium]